MSGYSRGGRRSEYQPCTWKEVLGAVRTREKGDSGEGTVKPVATAVPWEAWWLCPGRGDSWQQWVQDAVPGHLNSPGHAGCRVSTSRDAHRQPGGQWHRGHEGVWGCSASLQGKARGNLRREGSGQSEPARGDSRCRGHLTRGWSSASPSSGSGGTPTWPPGATGPPLPAEGQMLLLGSLSWGVREQSLA